MAEELDRNDPDLKYLSVERNQFNDPATQAEWTQKRLVWVPHENQCGIYSKQWQKICKQWLMVLDEGRLKSFRPTEVINFLFKVMFIFLRLRTSLSDASSSSKDCDELEGDE
uniref:Uncharacterized protein n=1 Tax=Glossina morsitans morsitans TaxID=37546 RepID=A0A1B0G2J6_GLOMM